MGMILSDWIYICNDKKLHRLDNKSLETYDIIFIIKPKHQSSDISLSLPLKLKLISLMQQTVTFWKSFCSRMWKIGMLYNRYESLSNFWTSNFGEGWRTRRWVGLKYVKRRDRHRSFKQHFHAEKIYVFGVNDTSYAS